ncbi:unnamed protein product [Paramecium sonneborni]|uniref:Protein kinase domain-containing protein n=1 Tax=Paramecium sonneborni TaxID=65129 RepID=A0A8S1PDW8_9CILI|nr:unnamed protein product [Paramecium sonneborni]
MSSLDNEDNLLKIIDKFQNNIEKFQKNHKEKMHLVLLIGSTGCGKSTIFNFLVGGDFYINNKELKIKNPQNHFSKMNGGMISVTKEPNFYLNTQNNHLIIDFPGFNDTNGELDQLLFQLLFYKIVSTSPIKVIYAAKNPENNLINRGNDLQEFVRQLNQQVNVSFQKFNLFLNCYLEDLSDKELEINVRKDLHSVKLSQLVEQIFVLRKAKTEEDVSQIFNDQQRQKLWKLIESMNSFKIQPIKLPKTEIISEYLRTKTFSTIAMYGNMLCDVFDKNYLKLSNTKSHQTLVQMNNLLSFIKIQNNQDPLSWYLNFISICQQLATNLNAQNDIMTSSNNFKKIFSFFSQFSNLISGYDELKISKQIAENQLKRIEEILNTRIEFLKQAQKDQERIQSMENQQLNLQQEMEKQKNQMTKQNQQYENLKYESMEQKNKYELKLKKLMSEQEQNEIKNQKRIQQMEMENNQKLQKITQYQNKKYQTLMAELEDLKDRPPEIQYIHHYHKEESSYLNQQYQFLKFLSLYFYQIQNQCFDINNYDVIEFYNYYYLQKIKYRQYIFSKHNFYYFNNVDILKIFYNFIQFLSNIYIKKYSKIYLLLSQENYLKLFKHFLKIYEDYLIYFKKLLKQKIIYQQQQLSSQCNNRQEKSNFKWNVKENISQRISYIIFFQRIIAQEYLRQENIQLKETVIFKNCKYVLELNFENIIYWKTEQSQLVAYGIKYNKNLKWFHANSSDLQHLYKKLCGRIFFGNVSSIYESKEILGSGASSKVYRVSNKLTHTEFASKCIRKDYIYKREDKERYNRLIQEIELTRKLDHETIVKMIDIYEGEKSFYIILELLKGESLHSFSKKNILSLTQIRQIISRCLQALCYLDLHNIIHRDLKLENLVLNEQGKVDTVKIIDFGLAIYTSSPYRQLCGTPGYIAPEMFIEKYPYTTKVDIFSLGAIFYKLLCKKSLFSGNTSDEILENNKKFLCNNHLKNCSDVTIDLIKQMLQKDPQKRISAFSALQHPFFGDKSSEQGIAEESPHEIVRTFPHTKPMQIINSNDNIADIKIQAIRGSQQSFEQSLGSNYFPSFDEGYQKPRNGSDHIIE